MRYGQTSPFFVQPGGDLTQGLGGLSDVILYNRQIEEAKAKEEQAKAEAAAARQEVEEALRSGDINRAHEVGIKYPQLADAMYRGFDLKRQDQKDRFIADSREMAFAASPQEVESVFQKRLQDSQAQGADASHTQKEYQAFQSDPEGYMKKQKMAWAIADKEGFDAWQKMFPEAKKLESTQGKLISDRRALADQYGPDSREVRDFDALVKSEQSGDADATYTPVYDASGAIVGQRNKKTGKVESDPRAGATGSAQVINVKMPDGSIKGFMGTDQAGIQAALAAGGIEQGISSAPEVRLKPGERMTEDGRVEAIPGSSEYIRQSGLHAKDQKSILSLATKTNQALSKIDEILEPKNEGAFASNFGGYNAYVTRARPGNTQNIKNKIESLKSDLKSAGLEIIRQGGSIGMMTQAEWPIVEAMIAKIDPMVGEQAARDEFEKIKAYLQAIQNNAKATYADQWGETQFYNAAESGGWRVEEVP
jgi:hypothetical protein